jgi:glycine/D-amino acid oxidase-like deaminating enzyme
VGGGFAGLSAAAWLARMAPEKSVAVFEAEHLGAGASGRTGGLVLSETAAGDLRGLGDVLEGYQEILRELQIESELTMPGVYELSHSRGMRNSPIEWNDSGKLRAVKEVPGGDVNPGKVVSGLAQAAERAGAVICEKARVMEARFGEKEVTLIVNGREVRAGKVLFATNAESLELNSLASRAHPKFTLGLATEPVSEEVLAAIGLASRKPFYTEDLPYLWGRLDARNSILFGAGLVHLDDWRDLGGIDVEGGETKRSLDRLERRAHGFHPALENVRVMHRWGGPILFPENWIPVFRRDARSERAITLAGFSGHGVVLSVYLGKWAAEVMVGRKELPEWDERGAGNG